MMTHSFSDLSEDTQNMFIQFVAKADRGAVLERMGGMCAWVYVVDTGNTGIGSRLAVKVPRKPDADSNERARRFLREIEIEHSTYRHKFVGWAYDYDVVMDTPVALYRLWDGDLSDWIPNPGFSAAGRLATLAYLCSGLQHCRIKGLKTHQDLKPQNILMRKTHAFPELGEAMVWPMIADFGLANMSDDLQQADGARPYMAPEQWLEGKAVAASDVFSLGVICCEVLSGGLHPLGEQTSEWWPIPSEGKSKKWSRDDLWIRWANAGTPLKQTSFIVPEAEDVIRACLHSDPAERPGLGDLQSMLLDLLRSEDYDTFLQADFQIIHADADTEDHEWSYRDERLARLKRIFGSD